AAGEAGRTSACRVIGFSSRQTSGCCGSWGRSYISSFHLGDVVVIQVGHHPHFFPPRFEIVAEQENSNGFPAYAWNQFALDGFFRYQTHGPTGATFRRAAAHHCHQALFLTVVEHFGGSRPLSFVQRPIQSTFFVTTANIAYGLGSYGDPVWQSSGPLRPSPAATNQGTPDDPNRLDPPTPQLSELFLVVWRDVDAQRWTTHASSMRQNNST